MVTDGVKPDACGVEDGAADKRDEAQEAGGAATSRADALKPPEKPSAAVPVGLIIMGLLVGLGIMFSGFINALTPEDPTIDLRATGTAVGEGPEATAEGNVDAPRGMKLTLESMSGDVGACSVKAPSGTGIPLSATKDEYGNTRATFTADTQGSYAITCPEKVGATVTNPAAADQYGAQKTDTRNAKVGAIALGGGLVAIGIAIGVIGNRRYDREMARYKARVT